jgi:hypothetical protein
VNNPSLGVPKRHVDAPCPADVRVGAEATLNRSSATFLSPPDESRCGGYTRAKIENGQGLHHSPSWGSARVLPVRLARGPSLP